MFQHGRSVFEREKYILQMLTKRDRVKCNYTFFTYMIVHVHTPTMAKIICICQKYNNHESQQKSINKLNIKLNPIDT